MSSDETNFIKGRHAEQIAIEFLLKKGLQILAVNWRSHRAEIDIVAKDQNVLVFVEVKSRSSDFFGSPELAVNNKKKKLIVAAATSYMYSVGYDGEIRFDIISIILKSDKYFDLNHYEDAFFPGI